MKCKIRELNIVFYNQYIQNGQVTIVFDTHHYNRDNINLKLKIQCAEHQHVLYKIDCTYEIELDLVYNNEIELYEDIMSYILNEVHIIIETVHRKAFSQIQDIM